MGKKSGLNGFTDKMLKNGPFVCSVERELSLKSFLAKFGKVSAGFHWYVHSDKRYFYR